ncbi:MAG: adenylosuccinate lyase, partial [Marinirhabdus sp.]
QKHKETMTENCFDWLITPQKVACQARAMTALYFLGTEMAWVHPELKTIIETNLHKGSAGYQNRGAKTIEKILKYNKY